MKNRLKLFFYTIGSIIFGALFVFFLIGAIAISYDKADAVTFGAIAIFSLIPSVIFLINVARLINKFDLSKKENEKTYKYNDSDVIFTYEPKEKEIDETVKELVEHFKSLSFSDKIKVMNLIEELTKK